MCHYATPLPRQFTLAPNKKTTAVQYLAVVVEDNKVAHAQVTGAVHGLKRHATGDGPVADYRNAVVPPLI